MPVDTLKTGTGRTGVSLLKKINGGYLAESVVLKNGKWEAKAGAKDFFITDKKVEELRIEHVGIGLEVKQSSLRNSGYCPKPKELND